MWKYRQNERFINFFPEVNIGHHVESVPFMLLLHKQFEFHLKVRCTAWQEAWNSISSHCVTSRDKLMWHYSRWLCKNVITRKLWVFVFFRICFCLSMCKIIFFSCFVVISNVFTRFINDSLSLRTEPLTVRNCSPWLANRAGNYVESWYFERLNTLYTPAHFYRL